jgi:hypothetical protein
MVRLFIFHVDLESSLSVPRTLGCTFGARYSNKRGTEKSDKI